MDFRFFIISIIFVSVFVGTAYAQSVFVHDTFTQEEIDEMKKKAVLITLNDAAFMIELFPEDAPNHVYRFLDLAESGYYDGVIFHRILPGFVIQAGDPHTKDPNMDQSLWGTGGPGYEIQAEFNTIQHDRGIVSMARGQHDDSAGSQFFIMHKDTPFLDGKYSAFGRLVPGTHSLDALDYVASLETDDRDVPLDVSAATIQKVEVIYPYTSVFDAPERNQSIIIDQPLRQSQGGGVTQIYENQLHDVKFNVPYRWEVIEGDGANLNLIIEPKVGEHNVQAQIEQSGFIPQVIVGSEPRDPKLDISEINTAFFSIQTADKPLVLSNYVFESDDGIRVHLMITTQNVESDEEGTLQFKIVQIHFNNEATNYSVIYVNTTEWFRYEVAAFKQVLSDFEISINGNQQKIDFIKHPVFKQVFADASAEPEPESLPPARIGGCLIATASYGSELAPQVQLLREIRDNTVLQTQSGALFMNGFNQFYYSFSPTIADYERENPVFKEAVKLTLTPMLTSLTVLQYVDVNSEHDMLGYGIGIILLNIGMYFLAPAVLIMKIRNFCKLQ